MSDFLVLSRAEIEPLLTLPDAMDCVEQAFRELALGQASLFPVIRERIEPYGGYFGVKAGHLRTAGVLGYKGGGFWASNRDQGVAAHQSVIVLYSPATGVPMAALDGNFITVIRTGAAGAIAARVLARRDSHNAALIGTGVQARIQLTALRQVLPIERVRCYSRNPASAAAFAESVGGEAADSIEAAVDNADVVVTATPSFEPLVRSNWIRAGTHINAFGADTRGKQELDIELVSTSTRIADHLPQSREIGEFQHAFRAGRVSDVHAELGEVLAGMKPGRTSPTEITIFDATGIALQDLAVAARVYDIAQRKGVGTHIKMDS